MKLDLYGWFPQTNIDTLTMLIKKHNVKTVLEIGCFLGKSTKFFVDQGCRVISIDTFEGSKDLNGSGAVKERLPSLYEQFVFNMKELGIKDKVTVFKGNSHDYAKILGNTYNCDMVFVDGSHEYEDVSQDIRDYISKAKKVICGDDYTDTHPGVKRAVDELLPKANKDQRCWYFEL